MNDDSNNTCNWCGADLSSSATGRIAFESDRTGDYEGEVEIFVMNPNVSIQLLTQGGGGPTWSPDGRRIVFNSDRDGNWQIFVMDADGGNQRQLTTQGGKSPTWCAWCPVE